MAARILPDTLFGRLFVATLAVVAATLLVILVLILRERREFALLESGAGAAAAAIVEASEDLASLPRAQRAQLIEQLRAETIALDAERPRRGPPPAQNPEEMQRVLARRLETKLPDGFKVAVGPAVASRDEVIEIRATRFGPGPPPPDGMQGPPGAPGRGPPPDGIGRGPPDGPGRAGPLGGPGREPPRSRTLDVSVVFPDGDRVLFRAPQPRAGPPPPRRIFLEIGILTAVLSIVLLVMTRTITRPLADLASAADAAGRGTPVPTLEERGAVEVRAAIHAFNAMQERLRRYLDSRTRVLAAMSHDLRTPITRLRLRVESIDDEALRQRCVADLEEMTSMVRGGLSVFRGLNDDEPRVPVDVGTLVRDLAEQYSELGKSVTSEGATASPYPAKPLALKRCLGNLIDNAVQYGKRAHIRISDGDQVVIRIADQGPGIPIESLEQVFEPFFRLEASRNRDSGGTGLGLSIARDAAQAHGGTLTLANLPEGGLEAVLTLPR